MIGSFGKYKIEKVLEENQLNSVYLGKNIENKNVILKVCKKNINELKILKRLTHPNIITMYDNFPISINGKIYNVMVIEYCDKGDLYENLNFLDNYLIIKNYFTQIVSGLMYIHSLNISHGDIKPENIVINKNGNVKLIDFGLSYCIDKYQIKCGGKPKGTIKYMAPELTCFLKENNIKKKLDLFAVDMWALGIVYFIMIHKCFPFSIADESCTEYKNYKEGILSKKWKSLSTNQLCILKMTLSIKPEERASVYELFEVIL